MSEFAEAENITVEDADIDAEMETMAGSAGEQGGSDPPALRHRRGSGFPGRSLHTRKTLARLVEIASQDGGKAPAKKKARAATKKPAAKPRKASGKAEDVGMTETQEKE